MRRLDSTLPVPDADAQRHSASVVAHIRGEIGGAGGFISLARYMELVLYAPALGYYVAGARKFGASGDFVTGPELTPLYGAAIARQLEPILSTSQASDIVELGAGSGALAVSIVAALASRDALPSRYRILEISPELRARQQQAFDALPPDARKRINWLDRLPPRIDGVVVLNEVLDAIAPHVVVRRGGHWFERGVTCNGDVLRIGERPLVDARILSIASARFPSDGDYVSEVNPAAEALVATIAKRISSGAMLVIDYGFPRCEYYHPQRQQGTLVGHYRHRVHADPLLWPGLSDLTAHVDFTAMAEAGERAGLTVAGFATQASFLIGCGILDLLRESARVDSIDYVKAAAAVQTLLSPAEMGELFKVLMLARGDAQSPLLAVTDMTERL